MSARIARCPICDQRFVVSEAHRVTCSAACRTERFRRFNAGAPTDARVLAPREPNRGGAALADTRANVARLLTEGRSALRLAHRRTA